MRSIQRPLKAHISLYQKPLTNTPPCFTKSRCSNRLSSPNNHLTFQPPKKNTTLKNTPKNPHHAPLHRPLVFSVANQGAGCSGTGLLGTCKGAGVAEMICPSAAKRPQAAAGSGRWAERGALFLVKMFLHGGFRFLFLKIISQY